MEKKDMYELRELYDKLSIPLAEFSRRAGVSELTVAKIRDGHSARRSSVNALLATFAKIYELDNLSIDTVKGIIINDKLARREQSEKRQSDAIEQTAIPSVQESAIPASVQTEVAQIRNVARSEGDMLLNDFAKMSGIPIRTLCNWKDASPPKIEVISHKRDTGGGFEYFISPDEQEKALEMRKRYPGKKK